MEHQDASLLLCRRVRPGNMRELRNMSARAISKQSGGAMKTWPVATLLFLFGSSLHAQQSDLKNWYNDPFFTLSQGFADCPVPLGPLMTHAQMESDAHYRVERGTTCWLAHKCSKPNSYLYDAPIADAIHAHFTDPHAFDGTSIWIMVQRRFVYVDGCAPRSFDRHALQQELEAIPDVEQVFMRIGTDAHGPLPYKTLAAPDDPANGHVDEDTAPK
jgi:hypothetical protein